MNPITLGVCTGTHDSAAALIVDGQLIGLVEEERFNGEKHTRAYPAKSIRWLLTQGGVTDADVTHVAYNFDPIRYLAAVPAAARYLPRPATRARALPRAWSFATVHRLARKRVRALQAVFPGARVDGVPHHRAHGLYAFAASGYPDAAVLVVDSLGETTTTSIAHAQLTSHGVSYRTRDTIADPASLGHAYGAITQHLGWRRGDEEGTVMALAALGDPARFRNLLARAIPLTRTGFAIDPRLLPLRVLSSRWPRVSPAFTAATCPPRAASEEVTQIHADLAAALQERTEIVMVHLARRASAVTGARRLCLGGGVAMNCVSIGRIIERAGFDLVAVPPAPGDSGSAVGAALDVHLRVAGRFPGGVAGQCYLGPSYRDVEVPEHPRPGLTAQPAKDPVRLLAERLAGGQIIGVFRGRLEAGPRALGNRSILASPLRADVVERLNSTIKFREPFRPFAPVVLADMAAEYFTLSEPSPYMSIASGVTSHAHRIIPAIVHANDTARVQTLTREDNPFLADVLTTFAEITGVPVLINTSLNVKGKPICGEPQAALDCLAESGLDALLLERWWVTKQ